jgi:hypothetical protein
MPDRDGRPTRAEAIAELEARAERLGLRLDEELWPPRPFTRRYMLCIETDSFGWEPSDSDARDLRLHMVRSVLDLIEHCVPRAGRKA